MCGLPGPRAPLLVLLPGPAGPGNAPEALQVQEKVGSGSLALCGLAALSLSFRGGRSGSLAVWPWLRHLTSLRLGFPAYKVRITAPVTAQV